ncbi:MAG: potassium transporter TrkA [Thermoplasmata archaeon HGW-Thermoplasmata-1]|nr:MAG: potassium transporter TrkA [Thermoplasmata archaeon HGW-Thermoplasmata-1]
MYVILGCGAVGARVAELLTKRGREIIAVDNNKERVENLRERGFNAIEGDMTSTDIIGKVIDDAEIVMILAPTHTSNLNALKKIKKEDPQKFVVVRAPNPVSTEELREAGADYVILTSEIMASAVVRETEDYEMSRNCEHLISTIKAAGNGGVGIFMHNQPDPDSIASALALGEICKKNRVAFKIYYSGRIGHQQNRALVNMLDTDFVYIEDSNGALDIVNNLGKIALVDCSLPGINNVLPKDIIPDIVIDHHQVDMDSVRGEFVDIRPSVGSVSTMMTRYLQQAGIVPGSNLSTALLHGIRIDTAGFTRNTTPTDLSAAAYLSPLIDTKLLNSIESPPISVETMDVMARAIANRHIRGSYLATSVGFITDRDSLPQAAEFLLRLEGVATVLAFGIMNDEIMVSARSKDSRVNLGDALQNAFGKENAGGHAPAAGGQIPLGILGDVDNRDDLLKLVERVIEKQFFNVVGAEQPSNGEALRKAVTQQAAPAASFEKVKKPRAADISEAVKEEDA